jgi:hypothetical protein
VEEFLEIEDLGFEIVFNLGFIPSEMFRYLLVLLILDTKHLWIRFILTANVVLQVASDILPPIDHFLL